MPSDAALAHEQSLRNPKFLYAQGPEDVDVLLRGMATLLESEGPLGVDTETTGLDPLVHRVRLVQIATADFALVVDLNGWRSGEERQVAWGAEGLVDVRELLEGSRPKVLQNAAFDVNFLLGEGVVLGGPVFDAMIAAKLVNNGTGAKNDLGSIVQRVLKCEMPKELQKADWGGEITDEMLVYSARDAICLPRLCGPLGEALQGARVKEGTTLWDIFRLEMQALRPIALMQWHGFGFDLGEAQALRETLVAQADALQLVFLGRLDEEIRRRHPEDEGMWLPREADGSFNTREKDSGSVRAGTKRYAGFNPRSPQQMAKRFEQAGILLPPNEKGLPSLDQNLLAFQRKEEPLIDAYLTWKNAVTRVSHVEKLIESVGPDGRIHAGYRQMGTDTGRLSCATPNLQQVPREKEFRGLFKAAPGYVLVVADFSQVELRVAAELSGEPRMQQAYADKRDLHTETAALVTGKAPEDVTKADRTSAKLCFSGDTEVLTPSGWVRLDAYGGEQVAQYVLPAGIELNRKVKKPGPGYVAGLPPAWDGNCGSIEFVSSQAYGSFWSDDVWASSDRNYDVVATGNHEILYIDAYGNAHKRALKDVVQPRLFLAAGYLRRETGLGELRSRLLAMVVADGSFKTRANWVSLGFSKRRKIHRCEELLKAMGIEYDKKKYSNGDFEDTTFLLFKLEQAAWLLNYTDAGKKLKMETCLRDVDALSYLAEAQYWDGVALEGQKRDRVIVCTTVKEAADVMQAMAVSSGIPCTVHEAPYVEDRVAYRVSYAFRTTPTWRASWEPQPVDAQQVYCVQVPSGLLLIRRNGKACVQGNCNFGLLYGAGPATLQKQAVAQYGIDMPMNEAKQLVEGFRAAYPQLYEWQTKQGNSTTAAVFTMLGRRRMLVGFNDKFTTRINTVVQGSAGDIAKLAIARIWQHILAAPLGEARLIAMVHDEIVLEVRQGTEDKWAALLKGAMESAGTEVCTQVPIVAEVSTGATWAEAK